MYQRRMLGLLSVVLLATGAFLAWTQGRATAMGAASGSLVRMGFLGAAVWLAWPQLERFRKAPVWLWTVVGVGAILLVSRPKLLLVAAPFLVAIVWLNSLGRRR